MPGKFVKYDEDIVRFNIKKVACMKTAYVIAPSTVKPVISRKSGFVGKDSARNA